MLIDPVELAKDRGVVVSVLAGRGVIGRRLGL
jgi:hypothetical protein